MKGFILTDFIKNTIKSVNNHFKPRRTRRFLFLAPTWNVGALDLGSGAVFELKSVCIPTHSVGTRSIFAPSSLLGWSVRIQTIHRPHWIEPAWASFLMSALPSPRVVMKAKPAVSVVRLTSLNLFWNANGPYRFAKS